MQTKPPRSAAKPLASTALIAAASLILTVGCGGGSEEREPAPDDARAKPATPTRTAAPASPSGKGGRPVEPRPRIRSAREALDEISQQKLYQPSEIRDETAGEELLDLYAPTATSRFLPAPAADEDAVLTTVRGVGALPHRVYDVRLAFWWDEVRERTGRVAKLKRFGRLEAIDVHEVPPPTAEYTQAKKRALRLVGVLRIATAAFDPLSLATPEDALQPSEFHAQTEQEALDRLNAWMGEPDVLTTAFEAAVAALPPQVVVEKLFVGRKRFELALAGIDEASAVATAERLAPEIAPVYEEPKITRRADTFLIICDRKK